MSQISFANKSIEVIAFAKESSDSTLAGVLARYLGSFVVWAAYLDQQTGDWVPHSGEYFHLYAGSDPKLDNSKQALAQARRRFVKRFLSTR